MLRIDSNTLGKYGYSFLRQQKIVPDKDKNKLTFKEIEKVKAKLLEILKANLSILEKDSSNLEEKNVFSMVFYSSILAFVNNTDMNKYVTLTTDGTVDENENKTE